MKEIVVALQNTVVHSGGIAVVIRRGEAWAASSAVVREHPDVFTSDPSRARGGVVADRPVERETRAPGEKSNARRTR